MKAKIIIENGLTKIELSADNEFDGDILGKLYDARDKYEISTDISGVYKHGIYGDHKLLLYVNPKKKQ